MTAHDPAVDHRPVVHGGRFSRRPDIHLLGGLVVILDNAVLMKEEERRRIAADVASFRGEVRQFPPGATAFDPTPLSHRQRSKLESEEAIMRKSRAKP